MKRGSLFPMSQKPIMSPSTNDGKLLSKKDQHQLSMYGSSREDIMEVSDDGGDVRLPLKKSGFKFT